MVDAARQALDELMGRNRNLHPSEAQKKISWDDPEYCPYYVVKFCPHDLFINTRADLGPCTRLHDDEAKDLYEKARLTARKRQYEEDFLRFCISMLTDVDRKIQKGKQRLDLMNHGQQPSVSKYQEHLNNINGRIKKLVSEAEEAGTRGDVDQAQDLMILCEQLKVERDSIVHQHESILTVKNITNNAGKLTPTGAGPAGVMELHENSNSPRSNCGSLDSSAFDDFSAIDNSNGMDRKSSWLQDGGGGGGGGIGAASEKQMEVCEVCGAFLIVGDAQQRIEDHLMGKQHLGYSKLRKAVEELHDKRQKEREEEEQRRREERESRSVQRSQNNNMNERGGDRRRDNFRSDYRRHDNRDNRRGDNRRDRRDGRGRSSNEYNRYNSDRYRHQKHRRSRSRSQSSHSRNQRDHDHSRSRSRSHNSRY